MEEREGEGGEKGGRKVGGRREEVGKGGRKGGLRVMQVGG